MQRLPSILSCALALVASTAFAGSKDIVFQQTRHGSLDAGVNRDATVPVGHCLQCHERAVQPSANAPMLFRANDNNLCFACHQPAGKAVYLGQAAYGATAHASAANNMVWPGPTPPARPAADKGECLNCHTPHGYRDGTGLVPNLEYLREEALCLACHDSTGPASTNVQVDIVKASAHPVSTISGKHVSTESQAGATFAGANRHVECVDCHNPHAANGAAKLGGVARVGVTNGAAGAAATFTLKPATDSSAVKEYELCFKCHSSYTTLPTGKTDKALELNPANASFHPVEAAGKNATAAMNNSLAGGTGLPHLTATSVITCADCHGSDLLPTNVSVVSGIVGNDGGIATGPHGSTYPGLLRARYDTTWVTGTATIPQRFALCFICHSNAPFTTSSTTATGFGDHQKHVSGEKVPCARCHGNMHGLGARARLVTETTWTGTGGRSCAPSGCHSSKNY